MTTENKTEKKSFNKRLVENLQASCKPTDVLADVIKAIEKFALDEVDRIKSYNDANKGKLTWGKYSNKLLVDVAKLDPKYILWLKKNTEYVNNDLKQILDSL